MCGRFTQKLTWRQIHDLYSLTGPPLPLNLQPRHNGAPAQDFAACRLDEDGNRSIAQLCWGWCPPGRKTPGWVRASSTLGQRPSIQGRRSGRHFAHDGAWCRPTGGSSGNGPDTGSSPTFRPLRTDRPCRSPLCRRDGESLESFTIITTAASLALADIHHRQPAIIDSDRFDDWLHPASPLPRLLELVREPHAGLFERRAVSTRVNSVQNDDPAFWSPCRGSG